MSIHALLDEFNKVVKIKCLLVRKNCRALRLPIPAEYLKLFDLKAGHGFNVLVNKENGTIKYSPIGKIEKIDKTETKKGIQAHINQHAEKLADAATKGDYLPMEIKENN